MDNITMTDQGQEDKSQRPHGMMNMIALHDHIDFHSDPEC